MKTDDTNIHSLTPVGCTLAMDPKAPRLTHKQVAYIIRCICGLEGAKTTLNIQSRSKPQGPNSINRWMEVSTYEGYVLGFYINDFVSGGSLSRVFFCKTPKGTEWDSDTDTGDPTTLFTSNELVDINKKLYVGYDQTVAEVDVMTVFQVGIKASNGNGFAKVSGSFNKGPIKQGRISATFPEELMGGGIFYDYETAKKVADAYAVYRQAWLKSQSTEE